MAAVFDTRDCEQASDVSMMLEYAAVAAHSAKVGAVPPWQRKRRWARTARAVP